MANRLPPLSALYAFEAAARHESFTKAADEICRTQSAVSRHIRSLEAHFGVELFRREHRKVELTRAGREFYEVVAISFRQIGHGAQRLTGEGYAGKLSICMHSAIAHLFIVPRISRFRQLYPEIQLQIVSLERNPVPGSDRFDVLIVMGHQPDQDFVSRPLFKDEIFPVCSPRYLKGREKLRNATDLVSETLLHFDDAAYCGPWAPINWDAWLRHFGASRVSRTGGMSFNNYTMTIQAAMRDGGIALGWHYLILDYLRDGSLVRPIELSYQCDRTQHIVVPYEFAHRIEVCAFTEWLENELQDLQVTMAI